MIAIPKGSLGSESVRGRTVTLRIPLIRGTPANDPMRWSLSEKGTLGA